MSSRGATTYPAAVASPANCGEVPGLVQTGPVNESQKLPRTVVLTAAKDQGGTVWRAVTLTEDGGLVISGHDLGPRVEGFFGCREYEFERRLSALEVGSLCEILVVPTGGDLLAVIAERFPDTSDLEKFTKEHGIEGQFWSRIGD